MSLATTDIAGVPLMAAGGPYHGNGSPPQGDYFAERDLQAIADGNNALKGELRVPIKIGHSRGQRLLRNSGLYVDEQPAAGWLEDFRVTGGKLLADLKKVPRKLAALIESDAFPTRSVELAPVRSQRDGRQYGGVVTALALLGAKAPAVRTLDDIAALYASTAYAEAEPTREVVDIDGRVLTLPLSSADAMEAALDATLGPRISESQYLDYARATGVITMLDDPRVRRSCERQ